MIYAGLDLHKSFSVITVTDAQGKELVKQKKLPNNSGFFCGRIIVTAIGKRCCFGEIKGVPKSCIKQFPQRKPLPAALF